MKQFLNPKPTQHSVKELQGMGISPDIIVLRCDEPLELSGKRFFVGVQFHPEFKSRPNHPCPLFVGLVSASLDTNP